ncbi:unnamed protein product [Prorocentrum cordatum]|uniref:Uncharacterized protein n=1 Tax=Prorocentrum cordatum TaxID=2364126 RepID=A0ABN9XY47_9DINO|nr:unnamed protein product [Polarella glacialis]
MVRATHGAGWGSESGRAASSESRCPRSGAAALACGSSLPCAYWHQRLRCRAGRCRGDARSVKPGLALRPLLRGCSRSDLSPQSRDKKLPSTPATMPRFRVPIRPGPVQSDLRRTVCFLGLRRTAGQRGQQERSGGGKLCPRGEGGRGLRGRGDAHERGALLMSVLSVLSRSRCRGARPWTCDPTGATRAGHPLAKPPRSVMLEESSPRGRGYGCVPRPQVACGDPASQASPRSQSPGQPSRALAPAFPLRFHRELVSRMQIF